MKKRHHDPSEVLHSPHLRPKVLARGIARRKRATAVPADTWLDRLIRRSPAFHAKVAEELATINVAQDFE